MLLARAAKSPRVVKWLLVLSLSGVAGAAETAEQIFARARALNPTLKDYTCSIAIQLKARLGFVPYNPALSGMYYYKKPDRHKLELKKAPSYLKKYPQVFGFNLPDLKRYRAVRVQSTQLNKMPVYKIILVPRSPGNDITSVEVYVHRQLYIVPKYDTFYKQGHLLVDIDFAREKSFWVYRSMKADFEFPSVRATAAARYSGYRFNQKLPDSLFEVPR